MNLSKLRSRNAVLPRIVLSEQGCSIHRKIEGHQVQSGRRSISTCHRASRTGDFISSCFLYLSLRMPRILNLANTCNERCSRSSANGLLREDQHSKFSRPQLAKARIYRLLSSLLLFPMTERASLPVACSQLQYFISGTRTSLSTLSEQV